MAFVSVLLHSAVAGAATTTTIDPSLTFGVWEGWGTSLAWWANVYGGSRADELADIFFTTKETVTLATEPPVKLPGLGLTLARYNAGGSSSAPDAKGQHMVLSKNMRAGGEVFGFWLNGESAEPTSSSWDWSKDAGQVAMLRKAKAAAGDAFIGELFSNTPMWWMLENRNPSGASDGSKDNLKATMHAQHATYLATIAAHAQTSWNLSFASVEAFNEPIATWWKASGTQEGCHFDVATQAAVVPLLRAALDKRGLNATRVSASDENTYDEALSTWQGMGAAAQRDVAQINVHGYQQGGGRRDLLYTAAHDAKKILRNSEYGDGDDTGLTLAANLNLDFKWLHPTAWVYWQVCDGGGWGLLNADEDKKTISGVSAKFFVLAQYARHVRPGDTIVDGGVDDDTVAALSPRNGGTLIVVSVNSGREEQTKRFDLSKLHGAVGASVVRWVTAPKESKGDRYVRYNDTVVESDGSFQVKFPAETIMTFEIAGVAGRYE